MDQRRWRQRMAGALAAQASRGPSAATRPYTASMSASPAEVCAVAPGQQQPCHLGRVGSCSRISAGTSLLYSRYETVPSLVYASPQDNGLTGRRHHAPKLPHQFSTNRARVVADRTVHDRLAGRKSREEGGTIWVTERTTGGRSTVAAIDAATGQPLGIVGSRQQPHRHHRTGRHQQGLFLGRGRGPGVGHPQGRLRPSRGFRSATGRTT